MRGPVIERNPRIADCGGVHVDARSRAAARASGRPVLTPATAESCNRDDGGDEEHGSRHRGSTSPSKNEAYRNTAISGHDRGPRCATEGETVMLRSPAPGLHERAMEPVR